MVDTRIAVKTLENAIAENFRCPGNPMPKSSITVDSSDVSISGAHSIPLSAIKRANGNEWWHGLEYDILVDWHGVDQNATYDIDMEVSSDFLTGQVTFELLYENKRGKYVPLARGQQQDNPVKSGPFVQRLKWFENANNVLENEDLTHGIVRLKVPGASLKQMVAAEDSGKVPSGEEMCVNFDMWFRAVRTDNRTPTPF